MYSRAKSETIICPELLIRGADGEPKKLGGDIKCKGAEEQCAYGAVYDRCRFCEVCTRVSTFQYPSIYIFYIAIFDLSKINHHAVLTQKKWNNIHNLFNLK